MGLLLIEETSVPKFMIAITKAITIIIVGDLFSNAMN
jgi:hypothetical protein